MEELTDAITSLFCLLEEQLSMTDYPLCEDGPFLAMQKTLAKTQTTLEETNIMLDNLVDVMVQIKEIQKQALKWQEMSA